MSASPQQVSTLRQGAGSNRPATYLLLLVLLPLFSFVAVFPLARTDWFIRTSKRDFWHAMEYQFADRPEQCDVVIFGDSTALLGADPRLIEARTGLKSCNFGLTYLGLATTGNLALDRYLASHKPPRFIVIELLAAHLRPPAMDDDAGIIDGFLIADRKLPVLQAAALFLRHPKDSFYFASQLWQQLIGFTPSTSPDLSQRTFDRDTAALRETNGFYASQHPGGNTDCFYQFHDVTFSHSYIAGYQAYAKNGTRVLIWPSPVRHCDEHLNDYKIGAAFLGLRPPLLLDDSAFVDAQHLSTAGVAINSQAIADALLTMSNQMTR